jgi:hypothetical protein
VNKEPPPPTSSTNENKTEDDEEEEEAEESEDWEKLLDGSINPLNNDVVEEVKFQIFFFHNFKKYFFLKIQKKFKDAVQIKKPTIDYSQWSVDDIQIKEADLAHVVEVSNFPSTFRTEDLSTAFKTLTYIMLNEICQTFFFYFLKQSKYVRY